LIGIGGLNGSWKAESEFMPTIVLHNSYTRGELLSLIGEFEGVVKREQDRSLARHLRRDFIDGNPSPHNRNTAEILVPRSGRREARSGVQIALQREGIGCIAH